MSDETQTPTQDPAKAAPTTPTTTPAAGKSDDPLTTAMRAVQADNAKLDGDLKAALAKLAERDAEVTTLRAQVDGYGRAQRESAIVAKLRNALPHASDLEVRGALAALHESGKVDRYSDKPDEVAKAALELIKVEAPSLTRAPTTGGGTQGARVDPGAKQYRSLI